MADPSPSEGRSRAAQPAGAAIDVDACEWLVYERLLPAVPVSVPSARGGLSAALVRHRLVGRRRDDVLLVLTEAATNAVWHAYRDTAPGPLYVNARLLGESLVVTVADRGRWPGRRSPSPGLGLGLRLMRRLADELKISHDAAGVGTCVQATFAGVAAGRRSSHAAAADGDRGELLREYLRLLSAAHAVAAAGRPGDPRPSRADRSARPAAAGPARSPSLTAFALARVGLQWGGDARRR